MLDKIHIDILYSINQFLNPVDRYLLRRVCTKLRIYFQSTTESEQIPSITDLIKYGYLEFSKKNKIWKQTFSKGTESSKTDLLNIAAQYGHLHIIQYLRPVGRPKTDFDKYTAPNAARSGHFDLLKWLYKEDCQMDIWVIHYAAMFGHLDILKWARSIGIPWNDFTTYYAAFGGHLKVLQWLIENNCRKHVNICSIAAQNGHLHIIKWARSQGCGWNTFTCYSAAQHGHLSLLQWLRENNCPWDTFTCYSAAQHGHLSILQWLRRNDCPWNRNECLNVGKTQEIKDWILSQPD